MTDELMALLSDDEQQLYRTAGMANSSTLVLRTVLARLAEARREAREAERQLSDWPELKRVQAEAAAAEREDIAQMVEVEKETWDMSPRALAAVIRARGKA